MGSAAGGLANERVDSTGSTSIDFNGTNHSGAGNYIFLDVGFAVFGAGTILDFQSIRSTLWYPLFAAAIYATLGYGKRDAVLAVAAVAVFLLQLWEPGGVLRVGCDGDGLQGGIS